jgi:hypothetical protein
LKRPVNQNERQLMRNLDFSSWQTVLHSFVGIAVVTVIGVTETWMNLETSWQLYRAARPDPEISVRVKQHSRGRSAIA